MPTIVSVDFAAALIIVYLLNKLVSKYTPLPNLLLNGVVVWLPPREGLVDMLLPKRHKRQKKGPVEQLSERFGSLTHEVVQVLESRPARVTPKSQVLMRYDDFETLDWLLLATVASLATWGFAELWSCVRTLDYTLVPFISLGSALTISFATLFLLMWTLGPSHLEFKVALYVGGVCYALALVSAHFSAQFLDAPLDAGFRDAVARVNAWLQHLPTPMEVEPATDFLHAIVALPCAAIAFCFLRPAFRFSQMYFQLQTATNVSQFQMLLQHVTFLLPLVISLTWVRPLTGDWLLPDDLTKCSQDALAKDCPVLPHDDDLFVLTESMWLQIRLGLVAVLAVMRVVVMRPNIQAYLGSAKINAVERVISHLGRGYVQADKDTTDGDDLNNVVKRTIMQTCEQVNTHVNKAAVQYMAPTLMWVLLAALIAHGGAVDTGACAATGFVFDAAGMPLESIAATPANATTSALATLSKAASASLFGTALPPLQAVTPLLVRGLAGFVLWWACTIWAVLSLCGYGYWAMLERAKDESEQGGGSSSSSGGGGGSSSTDASTKADSSKPPGAKGKGKKAKNKSKKE